MLSMFGTCHEGTAMRDGKAETNHNQAQRRPYPRQVIRDDADRLIGAYPPTSQCCTHLRDVYPEFSPIADGKRVAINEMLLH